MVRHLHIPILTISHILLPIHLGAGSPVGQAIHILGLLMVPQLHFIRVPTQTNLKNWTKVLHRPDDQNQNTTISPRISLSTFAMLRRAVLPPGQSFFLLRHPIDPKLASWHWAYRRITVRVRIEKNIWELPFPADIPSHILP